MVPQMPMCNLRTPLRARQGLFVESPPESPSPAIPTTAVEAYVAGMRACRSGVDLAALVHEATMLWPLTDHALWCELVASASVGYWMEGGRG